MKTGDLQKHDLNIPAYLEDSTNVSRGAATASQILTLETLASNLLPANIITVSKTGTITSIYEAINSIQNATIDNPYLIKVQPGNYIEPAMVVPSYVSIVGETMEAVVVIASSNYTLFTMSNMSAISDMTLVGTGEQTAIYLNDCGNFVILSRLFIVGFDIGINYETTNVDSYAFTRQTAFTDCVSNCYKIKSNGTKVCYLDSVDSTITITNMDTNTEDAVLVGGNYAQFVYQTATMEGVDQTGNAIRITNGGWINCGNIRILNWNKGVYADDSGYNAIITVEMPDFKDNTTNIEIDNSTCGGHLTGDSEYTLNKINSDCDFYITGQDPNVITVGHKGCNFTTIKDAVDSIQDSGNSNRYLVKVDAGFFIEDSITLKQYVVIQGAAEQATIVSLKADPTHPWLFDNDNQRACGVNYLAFTGILANQSIVKYRGNAFKLDHCRFRDNINLGIDASGITGTQYNYCIMDGCTSSSSTNTGKLFDISSSTGLYDVLFSISNFTTLAPITSVGSIGMPSDSNTGVNCRLQIQNCRFWGNQTANGIEVADGASLQVLGSDIQNFTKGLYIPNIGAGPTLHIVGTAFDGNTDQDIEVNHPLTVGTLNGIVDSGKLTINATASENISTLLQNKDNGKTLMSIGIIMGANPEEATDFTQTFSHGFSAGLITGGVLSVKSGLTMTVSAGNGYLYPTTDPETSLIRNVNWEAKDITVGANKSLIIYVDIDGNLNASESTPNFFSTIVVGRVVTLSNSVLFYSSSARNISAYASKVEKIFRYYLGNIYKSGSAVTSSGLNLNVDEGNYCYSTSEYFPSGGTTIPFSTWYRQGLWYTITNGQTSVPNDKYDDGTGNLHSLDIGDYYVKHLLLVYGGEESESYFLVYGQQQFDSLSAAETGPIPTIPDPLGLNVSTLAGIIVKSGSSNISEIVDLRPMLIAKSGTGFTSTSDHNSLSNLKVGDPHTQYLPVDGSRPMESPMDLGKNNIINAGTIQTDGSSDAVNVSAHVSRHALNGHDAFTFAAPSSNLSATSTNYAGNVSSLNCSNHTHAINAYSTNIAGLVKRDDNGDFAARNITATLIGNASNVSGIVAVGNGGTNSSVALNNNRIMVSSSGSIVESSAITASRALASNSSGIPTASATTATELGYVNGVTSSIQTQLNTKNTISVQTSTTATTSMTTVANQVVIVQVKADLTLSTGSDVTVTLSYNSSIKDTVMINLSNNDIVPVCLQYTETPGAATNDLVLATTNGTFNNIRYIITKIS